MWFFYFLVFLILFELEAVFSLSFSLLVQVLFLSQVSLKMGATVYGTHGVPCWLCCVWAPRRTVAGCAEGFDQGWHYRCMNGAGSDCSLAGRGGGGWPKSVRGSASSDGSDAKRS